MTDEELTRWVEATKAALDNERLTRARVDALERWMAVVDPAHLLATAAPLTFWQRLRWLVRGSIMARSPR